jgi:hypothetical protein
MLLSPRIVGNSQRSMLSNQTALVNFATTLMTVYTLKIEMNLSFSKAIIISISARQLLSACT